MRVADTVCAEKLELLLMQFADMACRNKEVGVGSSLTSSFNVLASDYHSRRIQGASEKTEGFHKERCTPYRNRLALLLDQRFKTVFSNSI